jgi:hypothetical protein
MNIRYGEKIMNRRDKSYADSARACAWSFIGIVILVVWMLIFSGCNGTIYLTDAEYSDAREENASITYYNAQIYSGWSNGYYYYYGKPHYYPWNYYYNTCPPSHHNTSTHIVINRPVNKRPTITNRSRGNNNTKIYVKPNRNFNIKTNTTSTKIKVNNTKVKSNRQKVTNKRRPK